jgi:hypothetical protein
MILSTNCIMRDKVDYDVVGIMREYTLWYNFGPTTLFELENEITRFFLSGIRNWSCICTKQVL